MRLLSSSSLVSNYGAWWHSEWDSTLPLVEHCFVECWCSGRGGGARVGVFSRDTVVLFRRVLLQKK